MSNIWAIAQRELQSYFVSPLAYVIGFFFLLVTQCWRPLYRGLGWLLLPLGQNALYAYTAHIVLVVLLGIALLPFGMVDRQLPWLNTLLQLLGLAVIWVLVKRRWFFPSPQARVRWALVSSGLAVAVLLAVPPELTPSQAGREEPPPQVVSSRRMANPFGTPVPRGMVGAPPPGIEAQALPEPKDVAHVRSVKLSAEHGAIELEVPNTTIRVGDKIEWYVGYTDSTVVLHDVLYGVRRGVVEAAWPILGRGKLQ